MTSLTSNSNLLSHVERGRADVAPAAWAAPVGFVLIAAIIVFNDAELRSGNVDAETFALDWYMLLRLALCGCCGLYGFCFIRDTFKDFLRFPGALIAMFAGWAALTVLGAINTKHAAASVTALGCLVLFAPAVLRNVSGRAILLAAIAGLSLFMAGSWAMFVVSPETTMWSEGLDYGESIARFSGIAGQPNGLGLQAGLLIVLALAAGRNQVLSWRAVFAVLALSVPALYLCQSRTAALATIATAAIIFGRRLSGKAIATIASTGAAAACLGIVLGIATGAIEVRGDSLASALTKSGDVEEITTLTGRDQLWTYAGKFIMESPLWGSGYGGARFVMSENPDFPTHHAHNLFINITLSAGIVAGFLLVAIFAWLIVKMFSDPDDLVDCIVVMALIGGIAENVILGPTPETHTLLFLIAIFWRQLGATFEPPARNSDTSVNGMSPRREAFAR